MVVEGAEHRYRPLTPQEWVLRFGGGRRRPSSSAPTPVARAQSWPTQPSTPQPSISFFARFAGSGAYPAGSRVKSPVPCVMLRMSIA